MPRLLWQVWVKDHYACSQGSRSEEAIICSTAIWMLMSWIAALGLLASYPFSPVSGCALKCFRIWTTVHKSVHRADKINIQTEMNIQKDEWAASSWKMINLSQSTDKNILRMFFLLYHGTWWLFSVQRGCSTRATDKHIIPWFKKKNKQEKCDTLFIAQECDSSPACIFKNYLHLWERVK